MSAPRAYRFGPFRVDVSRRLLTRDGMVVHLAPKPFNLLLLLLRYSGRVLTKEYLLEHLWEDGAGTEANLSVNIAAVRRALDEHPRDHRYVVTTPMHGYSFVADVDRLYDEEAADDGFGEGASLPRRLAVVPFRVSPSRGDDAHLGVGFADAVSSRIPPLEGWAVQSPQTVRRLADDGVDPVSFGRDLEVDAVLSGSIEHRPENLAVSVELTLVEQGTVHWGDSYLESDDGLMRLPDVIGRNLARALDEDGRGPHDGSNLHCSENMKAFQEYLKGRFLMEKTDAPSLREGIGHFQRALELDPGFGAAQAAVAGSYYKLWRLGQNKSFELAREMESSARRAMELDPTLPDPHFWLASLNMMHHYNWPVAKALFRRGLAYAPNSSLGHTLYSYYLALAGRADEAVAEARLGQALEPTNIFANAAIANILRVTGQVDAAADQFATVLRMAPNFLWGQMLWGWTLAAAGRYEESRERYTTLHEMADDLPWALAGLCFNNARLGEQATAREFLRRLHEVASRTHVEPVIMAFAHFGLGEEEETLEWLERAYEERNPVMVYMRIEPIWGAFARDPRFRAIVDRIGAPAS